MSAARYRVWHIPQIPGRSFLVSLDSLDEAKRLVDILADYDLFQFDNNIKPHYSNASGVQEWDVDEGEYFDVEEDA